MTEVFPVDPLADFEPTPEYRRSVVNGILESYNSNYDFLVEALQNAVDAVEDAALAELPGPFRLEVTANLKDNWLGVLDTGIGLSQEEIVRAFKPHVSLKQTAQMRSRRGPQHPYRGYKGVGLTFLAYGTDDVRFHSKKDEQLMKTRMQYGHAWATSEREDSAQIDVDNDPSPLDDEPRGTYIRVQFSTSTRPRSLTHLAAQPQAWGAIIRTRTAAGQVLLDREAVAPIRLRLHVTSTDGEVHHFDLDPEFLYPHLVERQPDFRFQDLNKYFEAFPEHAEAPPERRRQDSLYLTWDTSKIREQLTERERETLEGELERYNAHLYAFVPYQGSVWTEMNEIIAGAGRRTHLYPGLMLAVNGQRLADIFEIEPTRYEAFSRNVFAIVDFREAKPDQGRKTVQEEVLAVAKAAANRAVQYLGRQRPLLKPAGESPTPQQRQVERNHQDWLFNVQTHARSNPLHIPPVAYASAPLTEQDVVGLFHQLCALAVFPGVRVYATSQSHTYDCLVRFECSTTHERLRYHAVDSNPLGLSPFVIGDAPTFETRDLTLEFKNNLDGLIDDVSNPDSAKSFGQIDICVCWSTVADRFAGYDIHEITAENLDQRRYPGVTHLLGRDGEAHVISVVMLKNVVDMIRAGQIEF